MKPRKDWTSFTFVGVGHSMTPQTFVGSMEMWSKVLNLLSLELAFLWLEKQPPLLEGSKDLADGLLVFGEGVGVNKDIIHIAYCLTIVDSEVSSTRLLILNRLWPKNHSEGLRRG